MEQELPVTGESRPGRETLLRQPGLAPCSQVSFAFSVLSGTALGLLQSAPCGPHQGLQSDCEGSAQVGYETTETVSITHKTSLRHLTALQHSEQAFFPPPNPWAWNTQMSSLAEVPRGSCC